jgi:D-inositol-3-phosphate glycosyltransferase
MERRILQVSLRADPLSPYEGGPIGGQQVMVRNTVRALQAYGFGVDVLTAAGAQATTRAALGHLGRVVRLEPALNGDPSGWEALLPSLAVAAKVWLAQETSRRYRLVHSYSWMSGTVAQPLARDLRVPWIHSPGWVPAPGTEGLEPVTLMARQLHEADWVVVSSPELAQRVMGWAPGARVRVVAPGIDPGIFFPRDAGPALKRLGIPRRGILSVSGSYPEEGLLAFVEAWQRAVGTGRVPGDVWLVLVGPGTAAVDDASRQIRGMGPVPQRQLPQLYAGASVTVVPTLRTRGLSALESMGCGVAVAGVRVPGLEDVVVDGETGVLVDGQDPQGLVDAALDLAADPGRARRMGRTGERRVLEQFTVNRMGADLAELYELEVIRDRVEA